MTNKDVFQIFTSEAHCPETVSHGSLLILGPVLYSYGTHFAVALRVPSAYNKSAIVRPLFLFNTDKRSVTTSKHQSQAKAAVRRNYGPDAVIEVPRLTEFVNSGQFRFGKRICGNENRESFFAILSEYFGADVLSRFN